MKKVALYARVSSDQQKKEGTIQSQVEELKKHIIKNNDILVKEYVDEGYSGARLDRPAMDQFRKDIKSDLFESIYFLNTDRIARDVTYQTIIISEILKNKKQIIINGTDYIHNPENKFTLTVLGAVAELERAKIIERTSRGRQMRLQQGNIMGSGTNVFGYDYHKKTEFKPAHYTINEEEAKVVKYVFETYANDTMGMNKLCIDLEEKGFKTKTGDVIWRTGIIKMMLTREMYIGIRYFNMYRYHKEYSNPINGWKKTTQKMIKRDRGEWIGVQVPPIVDKELFEAVQKRISWNKSRYRNPNRTQLLSNLVKCGYCNHSFFALRRYYRDHSNDKGEIKHVACYKCNYKERRRSMHSKNTKLPQCNNREILSDVLEEHVMDRIKETMFNVEEFRNHIEFLTKKTQKQQEKTEKRIEDIDIEIEKLTKQKKTSLDLYITAEISREDYGGMNSEYDTKINVLKIEKLDLVNTIPLLHQKDIVDNSIKEFCAGSKIRFDKIFDFSSQRKFLIDYIDRIVYYDEKFTIYGFIPVRVDSTEENSEIYTKIEFAIEGKIKRQARNHKTYLTTYQERISMFEYKRESEDENKQD